MKLFIYALISIAAVIASLSLLPKDQLGEHKEVEKVDLNANRSNSHEGKAALAEEEGKPQPPPPKKPAAGKDNMLRWDVLKGLDYRSGKPNKEVKKFLKRKVRIPGFVVPLDLMAKEATEFLLVPTYGACMHTPPPPANQMVLVKMKSGNAPKREAGPVWVEGQLDLFKTETKWGKAGYRIEGATTTLYKGGY